VKCRRQQCKYLWKCNSNSAITDKFAEMRL